MMRKFLFGLFLFSSLASHAQREFWGTGTHGGDYGDGFIYKTDSNGDNLEIVHHFKETVDGREISALTLASNNKLYGMAASGGTISGGNVYAGGTFFEYDLSTNTFTVLQHFGVANEALPGIVMPLAYGQVTLTEVSPGVLYGIMMQGAYVFAYNISTGVFTKPFSLPNYSGGASNSPLQNKLNRGFIKAADGNFYVTTATNSVCPIPNPNMGSVMRMNAAGTSITVRHRSSCLGEDGYIYKGSLVEMSGKFFGVTDYGGLYNKGVIFEYNIAANTYLKRYDLDAVYSYGVQAITKAPDNRIYGVAHGGGIPEPLIQLHSGGGALFKFDPVTGEFEVKHQFTLTGQSIFDMGIFPTDLITGSNGKLYGVTQYGVFEYDPQTSVIRAAGRFNGVGFAPSIREVCRKPYYTARTQTTFTVCAGETFALDLESPNAASVEWRHNGVPDVLQTSATLTFAEFNSSHAGTWTSKLTNACGTTVTQSITLVAGDPEKPMIEASGVTEICEGEQVTLSAPEGFAEYHWQSGETSRSIDVTEGGIYSVTVNNGCESDPSDPLEVLVHALPATPVLAQSYDQGIVLMASGGNTYNWTLDDQPLDIHTDRIENAQPGTYRVYSVSAAECASAEAASVTVVITGNETLIKNMISVYPNPAYKNLSVKVSEPVRTGSRAELYNGAGKLMMAASLRSGETLFELEALPAGMYLMRVNVNGKDVLRKVQVLK